MSGNQFPNFSERLKYLMRRDGYENAKSLATAICSSGLRKGRSEKAANEKEEIAYLKRNIENHLSDYPSGEGLSGYYLNLYSLFFHCSADFLLGYIDMPTHEVTDIGSVTGLSENNVILFTNLKKTSDGLQIVALLNEMLDRPEFLTSISQIANACSYGIAADDTPKCQFSEEYQEKLDIAELMIQAENKIALPMTVAPEYCAYQAVKHFQSVTDSIVAEHRENAKQRNEAIYLKLERMGQEDGND